MSRLKAAGIHIALSIAAALAAGGLLWLWYPISYFQVAGADKFALLLGADLVAGPILTSIVFRPGKRGLRFDLTVIGIVQGVAFVIGLLLSLQSRPVFLVANSDRFVLVAANEVDDSDLARGSEPAFRSRSWTGPRLVAAELPADPKDRNELISLALAGRDLPNLPQYYRPYAAVAHSLAANARPLSDLEQTAAARKMLTDWRANSRHVESDVRWLPLVARKGDLTMLIDARSGQPLDVLPIDPW